MLTRSSGDVSVRVHRMDSCLQVSLSVILTVYGSCKRDGECGGIFVSGARFCSYLVQRLGMMN